MYFNSFPVIVYDSTGNQVFKAVTNLLRRVGLRSNVRANALLYDTYDVKEGETPESIADKLYDDPQLHWVILLMNDITDRYHQWPLTENQFIAHINDKYDNVDATHHYEISQTSGDTTIKIDIGTDNSDHSGATAITNYEYEVARQDEMRKIRLLDPTYIEQFVDEYKILMKASIV